MLLIITDAKILRLTPFHFFGSHGHLGGFEGLGDFYNVEGDLYDCLHQLLNIYMSIEIIVTERHGCQPFVVGSKLLPGLPAFGSGRLKLSIGFCFSK